MKITLVRDDGKVNTLRTLKMELLLEQMKTEVKAQPVSKMREALRYTLPGNSILLCGEWHPDMKIMKHCQYFSPLHYTDSIDFSRKRDAELYLNHFLLINMDEFDQISPTQQAFLKHILQKPVVNTRRPNASAVEELRRYASFIATSNHRDLLTDTSGSRRFIGIYMTGAIDVSRPIDYEQLYAQALELLYHNERYWFDSEEEAIMTENNREFEQSPVIEQLFMVYYRRAEEEEEGEWLLAIDILRRIQKASKMTFSARQASYFGRILQRLGVKSKRKTYGTYYHVVPLEVE